MTADWKNPDDDEEDDEYFSEVLEGAEETGLEPKFVAIPSMAFDPSTLKEMKVDELIHLFIVARNQLGTDRKAYKQRELRVKTHMGLLSLLLRDRGDMFGVDSFATAEGTAYRNKKETFRVGVWDELSKWVLETGNIHVIQKRVSPNAVKEIRESTGVVPPGVESIVMEEFAVRSPTARAKIRK